MNNEQLFSYNEGLEAYRPTVKLWADRLRFDPDIDFELAHVDTPPNADPDDPDIFPIEFFGINPEARDCAKEAREYLWQMGQNRPELLPMIIEEILDEEKLGAISINLKDERVATIAGFGEVAISILHKMDKPWTKSIAKFIEESQETKRKGKEERRLELEKETKGFIERVDNRILGYEMDIEMYEQNPGRVERRLEEVKDIKNRLVEITDRLENEELAVLLQTIKDLFGKPYWGPGIEYSSGWGGTPVQELLANLAFIKPSLSKKETIAYILTLGVIYDYLRPAFSSAYEKEQLLEEGGMVIHDEVATLHEEIKFAWKEDVINVIKHAQRRIMLQVKHRIEHRTRFSPLTILNLTGLDYDPDYPTPKFTERQKEEFNSLMQLLDEEHYRKLYGQLVGKAEAVKDNISDYRTSGIGEEALNSEMRSIRQEISDLFYGAIDKALGPLPKMIW